jgi:hypothetical protein
MRDRTLLTDSLYYAHGIPLGYLRSGIRYPLYALPPFASCILQLLFFWFTQTIFSIIEALDEF